MIPCAYNVAAKIKMENAMPKKQSKSVDKISTAAIGGKCGIILM